MCWLADYQDLGKKTLLLESNMVKLSVYGLSEIKVRAWDISSVGSSDGLLNRVSEVQVLDVPPGLQFVGFYQPCISELKIMKPTLMGYSQAVRHKVLILAFP